MLTSKGKYGIKALIYMAGLADGETATVADIAAENRISKKFLDTILGELRKAGFVHSRYGRNGGYRLSRPPAEIMVGHAVRVLDGPLAPIHCASKAYYRRCEDCIDEQTCAIRLVMLDVRNGIAQILDNTSIAAMRERGQHKTAIDSSPEYSGS